MDELFNHDISIDEVRYWHDILNEPTVSNIRKATGYSYEKVRSNLNGKNRGY